MTLEDVRVRYPETETFTFGDNRALCDRLLGLVRSGKKTGTCGALSDYEAGQEAMPVVGRQDIALDWDGNPALVIETVSVTVQRYCDVDEEFALSEGENADLAGWQADHRAYFERTCGWEPEMELVCERFRVVEDFAAGAGREDGK